jgi:hypothetical protein
MNSSVIAGDVIFSSMRIIYNISVDILKNIYVQQVDSDVAKCERIVGTWFNSQMDFLLFSFRINEFIY